MTIRIIDNKKINLTEDEWQMYNDICRSYDRPSFKGEELFRGLFESDNDGVIVFLKPAANRHTSMEVFMFMVIIFQHQHLRVMSEEFSKICGQANEKIKELQEIIATTKKDVDIEK